MILSYRQKNQLAALLESAGKGVLCHPNVSRESVDTAAHFQRDRAHRIFLDKTWRIAAPLVVPGGCSLLCLGCTE